MTLLKSLLPDINSLPFNRILEKCHIALIRYKAIDGKDNYSYTFDNVRTPTDVRSGFEEIRRTVLKSSYTEKDDRM